MSMRVYGYIRVSSKKQTDGDGPERQAQAIESFCKTQGLVLESSFSDSISGTVDGLDRPELARLLGCVDARNDREGNTSMAISGIVVERMDRLARSLMTSEILLKECRDRGLKVYAADRGTAVDVASDGADPTVILIRQVLAAVAEFDKSSLVRKMKAARDRIRARGEKCEGVKRYGHFPGEQQVIALAQTLSHNTPDITNNEIAAYLNAGGLDTRKGLRWTKDNVQKTLGPFLKA